MIRLLLFAVLFSMSTRLFCQNTDTIILHSPKKATVYSALLPGLGQAYNKKYWKIPIVYAAIGSFYYLSRTNDKRFRLYLQAYKNRTDDDVSTIDDFPEATAAQLQTVIEFYRKRRDFNYIMTGAMYVLNVIDAAVDAHFFYFDISDDLTMRVSPSFHVLSYDNIAPGLSLSLKL